MRLTNSTLSNDFTDALGFDVAFALVPGLKPAFEALLTEVGPLMATRPFAPTPDWLGRWSGHLRARNHPLPVRLAVNGQPKQTVQPPDWERDLLNGRWDGTLPLPELAREGNRLYGVFRAASTGPKPGFLWRCAVELVNEP